MYRNSEGYADPTPGAALDHITLEERRKKRSADRNQRKTDDIAAHKKEKEARHWVNYNQKREAHYSTLTWVKAWPKEQVSQSHGLGENV